MKVQTEFIVTEVMYQAAKSGDEEVRMLALRVVSKEDNEMIAAQKVENLATANTGQQFCYIPVRLKKLIMKKSTTKNNRKQ